ncbi:MAG: CPBP family intramembrane glutamic endopeptidase [Pseudomonadota bacterium]
MAYPGFETHTAPAAARAELWRTALGAVLILLVYAGLAVGFIAGAGWLLSDEVTANQIAAGSTPLAVVILLAHFAVMVIAVAVVTRLLHRRGALTLMGDRTHLLRDFLRMAGIAAAMAALATVFILLTQEITMEIAPGRWLLFLPLALPLLLLQTGAEELVFRGYLQQQLGARFGVGVRAAWMVCPALIFAVLHVDPASQGQNLWLVVLVITLFALLTADITARTGSIGAAWGLHFVNNVQALLIFSLEGPLSGLSLASLGLSAASPAALPLFAADAAVLLIVYGLWRRVHD